MKLINCRYHRYFTRLLLAYIYIFQFKNKIWDFSVLMGTGGGLSYSERPISIFDNFQGPKHFQIWRRSHEVWDSIHGGKDCFLPITQLYLFKKMLMNSSLRATPHLLVNHRN